MTKKFNSIVVIHKTKLKIKERRTLRGSEDTEQACVELMEKYKDEDYDVVVTYGGPFDVLNWMQLRQLNKTEVN
jgi:molybdopterin biosynthesis enzyme